MGSPPAAMLDEWTRLERRTGLLPSLLAVGSFRTGTDTRASSVGYCCAASSEPSTWLLAENIAAGEDTRAPDAGLRLGLWVLASFQRRRCYLYLVLTYAGDFP